VYPTIGASPSACWQGGWTMAGNPDERSHRHDAPGAMDDPFRRDLANAFGIILSPPHHGPDVRGNAAYGIRPQYGMADETITGEFAETMRSLVVGRASALAERGLVTPEAISDLQSKPYGYPPAAQQWPTFLYTLYLDARPFLNDGASVIAWGMFFRDVLRGVREWSQARRDSVDYEAIPPGREAREVASHPVLTRPAIIALCYADLAERYGAGDTIAIEAHGRGFPGFTGPDHPGYNDRYLVRAKAGRRSFFWSVNGDGTVTDHFMMAGGQITMLPLPDFGAPDQRTWQDPMPVQYVQVNNRQG